MCYRQLVTLTTNLEGEDLLTVLVAGLELGEVTVFAAVPEVLVTVLESELSPNMVDVAARGYDGLTFVLVLELVTMLDDMSVSGDVDAEDGGCEVPTLVLVTILVLVLVSVLMIEVLTGATTVGEIALEAIGKLVVVVEKAVEDKELLATGRVPLLHCTLW